MTDTSPAAKWPLTLGDPVRAVHYALERNGDCPYSNPESCPRETEVRDVIDAYRTWLAAHPTADDRTVIDGQPRESGPVAPRGPHSPSGTPTPTATSDRAGDGRTAVRVFRLQRDHDITGVSGTGPVADGVLWPDGTVSIRWRGPRPSTVNWQSLEDAEAVHGHGGATRIIWVDQPDDELTEVERLGWDLYRAQDALAFVREMCDIADRHHAAITTADVRTWLKGPMCGRQMLAEAQPDTGPDSRTDSQDTKPDNTVDTQTDNPTTSADSARTTPDNALREQYAAAIRAKLLWTHPDDVATSLTVTDAVMRVRDRRMEQLAAEVAHLRARAEQVEDLLRVAHNTSNRSEAERAAAVKRADRAEAIIKRVRRLATDWAILRTHGSAAYELRNALDESAAEQPEVVHPDAEQQASDAQQVDGPHPAETAIARVRALRERARTIAPDAQGPTWEGLDAALDGAPTEPHPAEAERDQAYRERAHLLAWLAALHPANAVITDAADLDEPGWQLLYLLVSGWQMSWHIAPRDADLFGHVEHVAPTDPRAQWDGHSTAEKYERIQEHTKRLSQADTTKER